MSNWTDHEPKVRQVMEKYNGGGGGGGLFAESVLGI